MGVDFHVWFGWKERLCGLVVILLSPLQLIRERGGGVCLLPKRYMERESASKKTKDFVFPARKATEKRKKRGELNHLNYQNEKPPFDSFPLFFSPLFFLVEK